MSNPYSEQPIVTLPAWNNILSCGTCCGMPSCPTPETEWQSKSASATSADTDYSDSLAEWTAQDAAWNAYQAWLAANPETRGPEPAHDGDPGAAPAPPEGYEDKEHGSWAPFARPAGGDGDDVPTLYRELATEDVSTKSSGTIKTWLASTAASYGDEGSATFVTWTSSPDGTVTAGSITYRWAVDSFNPPPDGGYSVVTDLPYAEEPSAFPEPAGIIPWATDDPPESEPCTATTRETVNFSRSAAAGGSAADLSGNYPPVAFSDGGDPPANGDAAAASGWPTATDWEWTDLAEKDSSVQTLGAGVGLADVVARATAKIPAAWPAPPEGAAEASSLVSNWPTIGSLLSGGDPAAEPPVPAGWPECDSPDLPIISLGSATVTPARYRRSVPDTHLGTWYKVMWDVLEEPTGWDATIDDPDAIIPDPLPVGWEHPQIPDPAAPARSFVTKDLEWIWTGVAFDPEAAPDATRRSPWYEPGLPSVPGIRRTVNGRAWCYRGPFGTLPTLFGDQVERLDPEQEDGTPILGQIDLGTITLNPFS